MDVSGIQLKFKGREEAFTEDQITIKEPFYLFKKWFEEVLNDKDVIEPNAVALATASKEGIPSCRYVLLKGFDKDVGFKFFTNLKSRKGLELLENPNAAMAFYWGKHNRSIRIEGTVKVLSEEESSEYFSSRPYQSQIGALASNQSRPIPSRDVLTTRGEELKKQFPNKDSIKKPAEWGGVSLVPKCVEFWQGQTDRLHDRIRFRRPKADEVIDGKLLHQGEDGWVYERLSS